VISQWRAHSLRRRPDSNERRACDRRITVLFFSLSISSWALPARRSAESAAAVVEPDTVIRI
jgi:hypothetical protein